MSGVLFGTWMSCMQPVVEVAPLWNVIPWILCRHDSGGDVHDAYAAYVLDAQHVSRFLYVVVRLAARNTVKSYLSYPSIPFEGEGDQMRRM